MSCLFSAALTWPWYVWGTFLGLIGLFVFVLLSAGYFCGVDRFCDRRKS